MMGHGIAEVAALATHEVYIRREPRYFEQSRGRIKWSLEKLFENQRGVGGESDKAYAKLRRGYLSF